MSKDSRGFFLFGALSGLIERARSSAEKESQRLFTGADADAPANDSDPPTQPPPQHQHQHSGGRKRKSASLASARHRPRPPRRQESLEAAMRERHAHARSPSPPQQQQSLPPRASSVVSERTHLAATVGTLALEGGGLGGPCGVPARRQPGVDAWLSDHPMLGGTPLLGLTDEDEAEEDAATPTKAPSTASKRKWAEPATPPPPASPRGRDRQPHTPPGSAAKRNRVGEAAGPLPRSSASSPVPPRVHIASTRSSMTAVSAAVELGVSAATQTPPALPSSARIGGMHATSPDSPAEPSSAVERARLEKVERELHRLKKIIASLLPDELNDDDLRSVYGDLDRPRRGSDDVISRLIKARFGALLPPLPTIAATEVAEEPRGAIPPAPPLPPPGSQLLNAVTTLASARGRERAARPARVNSLSSSALPGGRPAVLPMVVQRLRAELRPVAKPAAPPPPPPHKDPGVMTKLLEEMKHHRLRVVKKPEDMGCG